MKTSVLTLLMLLGLLGLSACSAVTQDRNAGNGGSDNGSTSPATPTSDSSPLYIIVQSRYEKGTTLTREKECYVESTATSISGSSVTCDVSIPELRLYFSELQFTAGTANAASCPHLSFRPYYFARSLTDAVTFSGNYEAAKCSKYASDQSCWGGAAYNLLAKEGIKFPESDGVYFAPETGALSKVYKLDSSNTIRASIAAAVVAETMSTNNSYRTNVNAANNLLSASRAAPYAGNGVDYYGSGEYQDYVARCYDEYYEPTYTLTITISDKDTATADGVSNQVYDWN